MCMHITQRLTHVKVSKLPKSGGVVTRERQVHAPPPPPPPPPLSDTLW